MYCFTLVETYACITQWSPIEPPSPMKLGEGWDGGVFASFAPIPAFPRCRGKEWIGDYGIRRIKYEALATTNNRENVNG